jgi:hypothetical protein
MRIPERFIAAEARDTEPAAKDTGKVEGQAVLGPKSEDPETVGIPKMTMSCEKNFLICIFS